MRGVNRRVGWDTSPPRYTTMASEYNAEPAVHPDDLVVVLTSCPDDEQAEAIARVMVEARVAACVTVLPAAVSYYRWRGALERSLERHLVVKTTRGQVPALEAFLAAQHPYEVPELLVLTADGADAYAAWVRSETGTPGATR